MLWWTDELETGIHVVDSQHREIFTKADNIFCAEQCDENLTKDTFEYLINYVIEHFATEEKYMLRYGYENFAEHRNNHSKLIFKINDLYKEFMIKGSNKKVLEDLQLFFVELFITHINEDDKNFAAAIKK